LSDLMLHGTKLALAALTLTTALGSSASPRELRAFGAGLALGNRMNDDRRPICSRVPRSRVSRHTHVDTGSVPQTTEARRWLPKSLPVIEKIQALNELKENKPSNSNGLVAKNVGLYLPTEVGCFYALGAPNKWKYKNGKTTYHWDSFPENAEYMVVLASKTKHEDGLKLEVLGAGAPLGANRSSGITFFSREDYKLMYFLYKKKKGGWMISGNIIDSPVWLTFVKAIAVLLLVGLILSCCCCCCCCCRCCYPDRPQGPLIPQYGPGMSPPPRQFPPPRTRRPTRRY